jgi:hypothetical protein
MRRKLERAQAAAPPRGSADTTGPAERVGARKIVCTRLRRPSRARPGGSPAGDAQLAPGVPHLRELDHHHLPQAPGALRRRCTAGSPPGSPRVPSRPPGHGDRKQSASPARRPPEGRYSPFALQGAERRGHKALRNLRRNRQEQNHKRHHLPKHCNCHPLGTIYCARPGSVGALSSSRVSPRGCGFNNPPTLKSQRASRDLL